MWSAHQIWGSALVQELYWGQTPFAWLNDVIHRQDIHPVQYYQDKADRAVRGAVLVLLSVPLLLGGWAGLGRRWPGSAWGRPLVGAGLVLTGAWGLAYWLEVPLFQVLPHWFWALAPKPLPWGWLLAPLALLAWGVLKAVFRAPQRTGRNLLLLVGLGFCLQHGFALAEGRGLDALRDRLLKTGHADFVHQALAQGSARPILANYDKLLESGELPRFPHATKPPGALLFFRAVAGAGEALLGPASPARFAGWAAWLLPLLAYAAVVPLFFLSRLAMPLPQAWVPAALFPLVPATALIALHADQFLNPLLGLIFTYCCVRALSTGSGWWGAAAGLAFYLATFVSFALVALGPLVAVLGAAALLEHGRWPSVVRGAAWMAAGFVLAYGVLHLVFGYSAWYRFDRAIAVHQAWKVGAWSGGTRFYFAFLNLVEFFLWCGIPLALLAAADMWQGIRRQRRWTVGLGLSRGLLLILLLLGATGKTAAESGRLWLFLVPLILLAAGRQVHRLAGQQLGRATMLVALLQFIAMAVLKCRQDFYQ